VRVWIGIIVVLNIFLTATPALAGLKDLHADKLPQTPDVLKAYSNVLSLEPMVDAWNAKWPYKTAKDAVVSALKGDLAELESAEKSAPDNEELSLLTGLTARYAYNVDVEPAYQVAVDAFMRAHRLVPADYRPEWFLGIHECQANQMKQGMSVLLDVEQQFPYQSLPIGFWDDYIFCAAISNMPAHELRAADYLEQLHAPISDSLRGVIDSARSRFREPDLSSTIKADDVWQSEQLDGAFLIKNFAFGFSFSMPSNWGVKFSDVENGVCYAQMQTGPQHGKEGDIYPNIVVISRRPKPAETLKDFASKFLAPTASKPIPVGDCPVSECLAFQAVKSGMYGADGDGYAFVRVFESNGAKYPGLLLETPGAPPPTTVQNQVTYYRPTARFRRVTGTLYYLVLLDTAGSVLPQAKKDFELFLKNLKVE
jgi:hypothetical protein